MNLRPGSRRREEPTIELTPLIDVVFLLLIFFLITTSFARNNESAIPVDLAEAATGSKTSDGKSLTLSVNNEGDVIIDEGSALNGDSLRAKLEELQRDSPESQILLRGDQNASHGRILEILDLVKDVGFKRVDMVVRSPEK